MTIGLGTGAGIGWKAWGTTVRVEVTDPAALRSAARLVHACVADAERAADVDRRRAQVHRLVRAGGRPARVGETLSALVAVALDVAERTDGAVDPTVGVVTIPLRRAEQGRAPQGLVPSCSGLPYVAARPAPGWKAVRWAGHEVHVPAAVALDLTATAKARTARLAAASVAEHLGVGALVEVGGDVAAAGPEPLGGWTARPEHGGGTAVEVPTGGGVAACRVARLVDPLSGRVLRSPWRAVVVSATDVVTAKAAAIALAVRGADVGAGQAADVGAGLAAGVVAGLARDVVRIAFVPLGTGAGTEPVAEPARRA